MKNDVYTEFEAVLSFSCAHLKSEMNAFVDESSSAH